MIREQEISAAQEQRKILKQAHEFSDLLNHPGWKHIYGVHLRWVKEATDALRNASPANGMEALRRWQLISELIERENDVINSTLDYAEKIKDAMTLDDVLLMEQLSHEHREAGDPGRSDPGGY